MYLPLPFPPCPRCKKESNQGYHRNCGGKLEVDPINEMVVCLKCNEHWNIWDSTYYCSCGHKFTAVSIASEVKTILLLCKVCMDEIERQQQAQKKLHKLSKASMRNFLCGFFESLGFVVGSVIGTAIETVTKLFFK